MSMVGLIFCNIDLMITIYFSINKIVDFSILFKISCSNLRIFTVVPKIKFFLLL